MTSHLPYSLQDFLRNYNQPPVAAQPVSRYDAPWKPTEEQKEPPF